MRRAFSLVELLVVIAVVGLLLGLLLPAVAGAMARARQTRCLLNCQQMIVALSAYAGDHKSWLPAVPVAPGMAVVPNQFQYGGLAGFFSLQQVGDGTHTGFGAAAAGSYADGNDRPILQGYLSALGVLVCPADREDRYYGDPYGPTGIPTYAGAVPLRPTTGGGELDVISYNISYVYFTGFSLTQSPDVPLWADETNGPDLNAMAWYGDGATPVGGTTVNSAAAGSKGVGKYAPGDNHGQEGGNFAFADGRAQFRGGDLHFSSPRGGGAVD